MLMDNVIVKFRLDEILKERNMTQKAIAEMTDISRQTIVSYCNKPRRVQMDLIARFCVALNVEPKDLIVLERI